MPALRALAPVAALASTVLFVAPARATPNFPAAIQTDLALAAPPACTICHATAAGGAGTVTQPFGLSMEQAGLRPFDVASLDAALATLKADHTSSVGDGIPDITKLEQGKDPNVPENGSFGPVEPGFGCARVSSQPEPAGDRTWIHGLVLTLVFVGARASRRRQSQRSRSNV